MSKKYLKIGIACLTVSIFLFGALSTQTKVNINRLTNTDIVYACERINGLGDKTSQALIKNTPTDNLGTVGNLPAVGEVKSKIINSRFTTRDSLRNEDFLAALILAVIFAFIGSFLATLHVEMVKKAEERLDKAFFGKGK